MNLYVSRLDPNLSETELRKLFSEYGKLESVKVITDYNTGVSRGFAFVEFANEADGQNAIKNLHNTEVGGQTISVEVARPREDRPKGKTFSGKDGFKKY
jgi:RNA recognition motif-containing protein